MRYDAEPYHRPRQQGALSFTGWTGSASAVFELSWDIAAPEPYSVMRPTLLTGAEHGVDVYGCRRDTAKSDPLVASALVYVPCDVDISAGDLVLFGRASGQNLTLGTRTSP